MIEHDDTAEPKRLIAERRYGEAIVACKQLLVTGRVLPAVQILLGKALLAEERFDDVRVEMLALVRVHPDEAEAHRLLGEAYLRSGQKDRAEEALERALALEPGDETARELLDEVAGEKFPVAQTIERWFGEEEGRTVETELPDFEEEHTPVPALAAPRGLIEPSIQVDPSLAVEASKLRGAAWSSTESGETADSTLPGAAPRAEGLREILSRAPAKPPTKPPTNPPTNLLGAIPKPGFPRPNVEPSKRLEKPEASRPLEPSKPTQVARPQGKPSTGSAPHPQKGASPRASLPAPAPRASLPAPAPAPASPGPASPGPASPAPASPGPRASIEPPPPSAEELALETAELAMPEIVESVSDQVPAPIAESEETELTRPLPPLSQADLVAAAEFRAMARPSGLPPPRALPPSTRPARDPHLDPRSLPSFGPAAPLPALPPMAPLSTAIAPLPPGGSFAPSSTDASTAPEIQLVGATARPRLGNEPVPPTALHVPVAPSSVKKAPLDRRVLFALGGAALFAGVFLLTVFACSGPSPLDEAFATVSNDGRARSYEAALALASEDGSERDRTLRALLFASMTLELGVDHDADAERLLGTLGTEASGASEARIARALIALGRGQGGPSLTVLSGLSATGTILVEAFRARALALAQVGTLPEAIDAARQAATLAPSAPRHAALYAELSVLNGDASGAQRVLDGALGVEGLPALRLVRAELGVLLGRDPAQIAADLDAILGPLAAEATGPELGRAQLCRARLALARRDLEGARAALDLALGLVPTRDPLRRALLAEAFLAAGVPARALEVASALTQETSDPASRSALVVRAALAAGDVAAAERAVGAAGAGPRVDYLRAQIAEARGALEEARTLYALAAAEPTLLVAARTAEGRLYLGASRPREAVVALTQALGASPAAADAVLLFARAAIAGNDIASAERAVAAATAIDDDAPEILAASALVSRARGRFDLAYAALERAVTARPQDGALRIDLGDAALSLGRLDDAGAAYEAALAQGGAANAPLAALRLAMLDLERGDRAAAEAHLGQAAAAPELERARARALSLVASGVGRGGVDELNTLRRGRASDPVLTAALAALYVQAEEDRTAIRLVLTALRADRELPEALVLQSLIAAHEGRRTASSTLASAERAANARGAPPSLRARILAIRGRIAFDEANREEARARADEALRLDPHCAEAHLVIADLEIEAERDPVPALRSAVAGTGALGEAVGRLALRLGSTPEGCTLGRRFTTIAPSGYDARNVRTLLESCE